MPDAHSNRYTHGHHEAVLRSHRWRTVENSAAYLLPHLAPGGSILDVGCGPGTITLDFAARVAPGRGARHRRRARRDRSRDRRAPSGGPTNVEFRTADVYALDIADDSFDIVHAHQVLQHLADPVAALREMRRVCKPGGVVAARDATTPRSRGIPRCRNSTHWSAMYDRVARTNAGEPDAGRFLLAWAHAAGFTDVEAGRVDVVLRHPRGPRLVGRALGRPHDRIGGGRAGRRDRRPQPASEVRAIADAWRGWAAEPDAWFAVLHGEILAHALEAYFLSRAIRLKRSVTTGSDVLASVHSVSMTTNVMRARVGLLLVDVGDRLHAVEHVAGDRRAVVR